MSTVKINNKNYEVPEFTFRHSKLLEQYGVSIRNLVNVDAIFTITSAFVAIVAKCDLNTADELIEQHIFGGGDLKDIYNAYVKALNDSSFFMKLLESLGEEKVNKATEKKSKSLKVSEKAEAE